MWEKIKKWLGLADLNKDNKVNVEDLRFARSLAASKIKDANAVINKRAARIKEELVDVRKAIKEVANQSGDVVDAAKGKSRPGRKKKTDTEIKIEKYLQSDEDHGPF